MKTIFRALLLISLFLASACCGEIISGKPDINVAPLQDLEIQTQNADSISDLLDTSHLNAQSDTGIQRFFRGSWMGVDIMLILDDDVESASELFVSSCEFSYDDPSLITYGGEGENRYCIPYEIEMRNSVEMLCSPTGLYISKVVFQKQRLVIEITEITNNPGSILNKNDLIDLLSQRLAAGQP